MLAAWDSIVRRHVPPGDRLLPAAAKAKSVLRHGAPDSAIIEAEKRLGLRLPPSYRLFLSSTDGAYARPEGAVTTQASKALRHTSIPGLGFLAAADICRLEQAEPEWLNGIHSAGELAGGSLVEDGASVTDLRPLLDGPAVLVTSSENAHFSALVPVGKDPEWQLWVFTRDDVTGYHSFWSWLRAASYEPGIEHVMELINWERLGDPRGLALYKVKDPAALPYFQAALKEFPESTRIRSAIIHALGRIRVEESVRMLELIANSSADRTAGSLARSMLAKIGSAPARDALARAKDWYNLFAVDDPRWPDIAIQALDADEFHVAHYMALKPEVRFLPSLRRAWPRAQNQPRAELEIAHALRVCGAEEGAEYLRQIANDSEHHFQTSATNLLAEQTPPISPD